MRSVVILVLATLALAGCTSLQDVTHNPRYADGLVAGGKYRTRQTIFVYNDNVGRLFFDPLPVEPGYSLLPESFTKLSPYKVTPSVQEYQRTKEFYGVVGLLPPNTLLAFRRIIFYDYFEGMTSFYVFRIENGPLAGREVCANRVMNESIDHTVFRLNPTYIVPESTQLSGATTSDNKPTHQQSSR